MILSETVVQHKKDLINISQFTMFEALSLDVLDCNHLLSKIGKIRHFVWIWGKPSRCGICATFGGSQSGYCAMKHSQTW